MTNSTPVWIVAMWLLASACSQEHGPKATPPVNGGQPEARDKKCVVLLHGKGEKGRTSVVAGEIIFLWPGGNGEGWGGREWRYFPEDRYQQMRASIASAIDHADCG